MNFLLDALAAIAFGLALFGIVAGDLHYDNRFYRQGPQGQPYRPPKFAKDGK